MYRFLIRNKWMVLACAILALVGLQVLVGRDGLASSIPSSGHVAGGRIEPQPPVHYTPLDGTPSERSTDVSADDDAAQSYVSDDDLVDNAEGYDPSPGDDSDHSADDSQSARAPQDPSPDEIRDNTGYSDPSGD